MIEITSGIPIPDGVASGRGRRPIYPWKDMNIGDSFFIPSQTGAKLSGTIALRRKLGERHCTRSVDGGVRVWRVA